MDFTSSLMSMNGVTKIVPRIHAWKGPCPTTVVVVDVKCIKSSNNRALAYIVGTYNDSLRGKIDVIIAIRKAS
jgi:hypothetical protein